MIFAMCRRPILSLFSVLLLVPACPDIDLGPAPFFCNRGHPACPNGYTCQGDICVREGSVVVDSGQPVDTAAPSPDSEQPVDKAAPSPDSERIVDKGAPTPDKGRPNDGSTPKPDQYRPLDQKPAPDHPPVAPKVEISEFLARPWIVSGLDAEWVELHNLGSQPVDINGWTLEDEFLDQHVINAPGGLTIPAQGYIVLGHSADKLENGGVNVKYEYTDFVLSNSVDEIILKNKSGTIVSAVRYGSQWTIPLGSSLSLKKNASSDHDDPDNWCEETHLWSGSKGDYGTPGAPPGC